MDEESDLVSYVEDMKDACVTDTNQGYDNNCLRKTHVLDVVFENHSY